MSKKINKYTETEIKSEKVKLDPFEEKLKSLSKKYNPNSEWGKFYSEVKKNKYFGKDLAAVKIWLKHNS